MSNDDVRNARELTIGQQVHLVKPRREGVFEVVSADRHTNNPFFADNVVVQRLSRKTLFGIIPLGRKTTGPTLLLNPKDEVIIV